jgi:hypothetical protein
LEQKEERCEAKQEDQDQPSAEQPVWNITKTIDGDHRQENDQGDAPTFNQPVAGIAFEHTPEGESVEDENQEATNNSTEVVAICRDHHAENVIAGFLMCCWLPDSYFAINEIAPDGTAQI